MGKTYDEVKLRIGFRVEAGQVVMQFSDHVEWVRMNSSGARKLAAMLTERPTNWTGLVAKGSPAGPRPSGLQVSQFGVEKGYPTATLRTIVKQHPHKSPHTRRLIGALGEILRP